MLDLFGLGVDQLAACVQDVRLGAVGGDVHGAVLSVNAWVRVDPIACVGSRTRPWNRPGCGSITEPVEQGLSVGRGQFGGCAWALAVCLEDGLEELGAEVAVFVGAVENLFFVGHVLVLCVVPG